ncbi:hypothetical protein BS17DRAFT_48699 [Gyrodon lividus]|nr:hypothetical protein BS17DRAFT_48699 [Gyrodon lividus]
MHTKAVRPVQVELQAIRCHLGHYLLSLCTTNVERRRVAPLTPPRETHQSFKIHTNNMDCCDILCGIVTCCCMYIPIRAVSGCQSLLLHRALCTICEPSSYHCCSKREYNLDEPLENHPQLVQDQPHGADAMMIRGQFVDNSYNAQAAGNFARQEGQA